MKVFISWSGAKSKLVAEELRNWLPTIVQSAEPFVSTQDIPIGGRGLNVLASELEECSFGILCLTQENKNQPWVIFEAGALSKVIDVSRVVPLLVDLSPSDLTGPLAQFQSIAARDRDDFFSMIKDLAEQSAPPVIAEQRLRLIFEKFWPEFESRLAKVNAASTDESGSEKARTDRSILEELLTLSRRTERELTRVSHIRTAENILRSRSGPRGLESHAWWGEIGKAAAMDLIMHLRSHGGSIMSFNTDDAGLHVIIDAEHETQSTLRDELSNLATKYAIPIHVRGEPLGDEMFGMS
jgi:hypothetical protein